MLDGDLQTMMVAITLLLASIVTLLLILVWMFHKQNEELNILRREKWLFLEVDSAIKKGFKSETPITPPCETEKNLGAALAAEVKEYEARTRATAKKSSSGAKTAVGKSSLPT